MTAKPPIERGSAEWWARVDAHTADIRGRIAEVGFVVQPVFGLGPHDPDFAYTIGLTGQGRPELICLGPTCEGCGLLIMGAAALDPAADEVTLPAAAEGLSPLTLRLRSVAVDGPYPLTMAVRMYARGLVSARQLLWPNDEGFYPGEVGWDDAGPHGAQPLLPADGGRSR